MQKKIGKKSYKEISFFILPYLIILFFGIIQVDKLELEFSEISDSFYLYSGYIHIQFWKILNSKLTIIFLILFFFATLLKGYKKEWYFIWLGLAIYFSIFLFSDDFFIDFINNYFWFIIPDDMPSLSYIWFIPYCKTTIKILIANLIFFLILYIFNISIKKIFFLISTNYYLYCFLALPYYFFLCDVRYHYIKGYHIILGYKAFLIFSSIFSIVYLFSFFKIKSRKIRIFLFFIYIFSFFIVINFFQILELLYNGFNTKSLFLLFKLYFEKFLILSNIFYYLIFLVVLKFYEILKLKNKVKKKYL